MKIFKSKIRVVSNYDVVIQSEDKGITIEKEIDYFDFFCPLENIIYSQRSDENDGYIVTMSNDESLIVIDNPFSKT